MRLLIFLLLASTAWAQEDKEVFTTGSKPFPAGTTVNPTFVVPESNKGSYTIKIVCDPLLHVVIRLEDDTGKSYGGFTRIPGPCGKILVITGTWKRHDGKGELVPIEKSTNLRTRVTNQAATSTTKNIAVEFDVTK